MARARAIFAPSVLELSQRSGNYSRLLEISRQRGDLLGFVMGLADRIVVLDFGTKIAEGTPEAIRTNAGLISEP